MKATLIISEEYRANKPSIFILAENGRYYGDQDYPYLRGYPVNAEYWKSATSSDSDRNFSVKEVFISDFDRVERLQESIFANQALLKDYPEWQPAPSYNVKRGKAWEEYKEFREKEEKEIKNISDYNEPYDRAINAARKELENILLSSK